jgi:hypothetical protein
LIKLKVTVPKSKFTEKDLEDGFKQTGKDLAKRVHKTYNELVADWKDDRKREIDVRPEFTESVTRKGGGILVEVKTDSEKYRYVDLGTEAHTITARPENPSGLLRFPRGYTPKTQVRSLSVNASGGKHMSGLWAIAKEVEHPGNKARQFEAPIIEEQKPIVVVDLKKYLKDKIKVETETYDL